MKSIVLVGLSIACCCCSLAKGEDASAEAASPQRFARAPQAQLQYSDPDGARVDWKLYSPFSRPQQQQRNERAETGASSPSNIYEVGNRGALITPGVAEDRSPVAAQPAAPTADTAVHQAQIQYKPFEMVPPHIKQLMQHMLVPQTPYIDPSVYIYQIQQPQEQQQHSQFSDELQRSDEEFNSIGSFLGSSSEESSVQISAASSPLPSQSRYYGPKFPRNKAKLGLIRYPEESTPSSVTAQQQQQQQQQVNFALSRSKFTPEEREDQQQQQQKQDAMPQAIHELLNLQAQLPYHVIADRILYKPKSMFVPKPFSDEDEDGEDGRYDKSSGYRTKIYYVGKDEQQQPDSGEQQQQQQQRIPRLARGKPPSNDNTQEQTDE